MRPSGTEPKLKIYVDLRFPIEAGESMTEREEQARAACELVADQLIRHAGLD